LEDKLSKRYLVKLLANLVSTSVGVGIIAIVPSALGPILYGKFVYIKKLFSNIFGFLDMGSSIAFFTKLSAKPSRVELIQFYSVISGIILSIAALGLLFINLIGLTDILIPNIPLYYAWLGLLFSFLTWFSVIFIKVADAYAFTLPVEGIKIGYKLSSFAILLFLIFTDVLDLEGYLYFQVATLSFYILGLYIFLRNKNILRFDDKPLTKLTFRNLFLEFKQFCSPLVIHSIVVILVNVFDLWFLQTVSGTEETGYYGLSFQIAAIGFMVTNAMTPIITREFSKFYELKNFNEIKRLYSTYIPMFFSMAIIFAVFMLYQASNLLYVFTDERFENAKYATILMSFFFAYQVITKLIGTLLFTFHKTKEYRNVGIKYMLIGIILTFVFIFFLDLGATGLAIKMLLSQILGAVLIMFIACGLIDISFIGQIKHQIKVLFSFMGLGYITYLIVAKIVDPVYNVMCYSIVYFLLLLVTVFLIPSLFSIRKEQLSLIVSKLINGHVSK